MLAHQTFSDAACAMRDRKIQSVVVAFCQFLEPRGIDLYSRVIILLRGGIGERHVHIMVVCHRAALPRAGQQKAILQPFPDEGELALCLERHRASIELIALPLFRLTRHSHHIIVGFSCIVCCTVLVAVEHIDIRGQSNKITCFPNAVARILLFKCTPLRFRLKQFVPPVHAKQALADNAQCIDLLINCLNLGGKLLCFAYTGQRLLIFANIHEFKAKPTQRINSLPSIRKDRFATDFKASECYCQMLAGKLRPSKTFASVPNARERTSVLSSALPYPPAFCAKR